MCIIFYKVQDAVDFKMKLVILSFVFVAFIAYTAAEEFVCQEHVPYKENECNGCFCSPTHVLGCTLMACPGVDSARLYNCEVGTSWDKGCNKCWCVKNQGTICTDKKC